MLYPVFLESWNLLQWTYVGATHRSFLVQLFLKAGVQEKCS